MTPDALLRLIDERIAQLEARAERLVPAWSQGEDDVLLLFRAVKAMMEER